MLDKAQVVKAVSLGGAMKMPAALLLGPLLTFFGMPIFGLLLFILLIDFSTGVWKAKITKTLNSNKFGDLMNRTAIYLILFTVIHALVTFAPMASPVYKDMIGLMLSTTEYGLFFGYCLKEMLSVFENLKAIQVAQGSKENFIVEMAIDKFGIDLEKALANVVPGQAGPLVNLPKEVISTPTEETETK